MQLAQKNLTAILIVYSVRSKLKWTYISYMVNFKNHKHVFYRKALALMETASFLGGDFYSPPKKI